MKFATRESCNYYKQVRLYLKRRYDFYFDNQKSKDELGMEYTDVNKSASEFFQQFIDHNLI